MKPKFNQGDVVAFETWPITKIPRIGVILFTYWAWTMRVVITKRGKAKARKPTHIGTPIHIVQSGKKSYQASDRCLVKLGKL